MPASRNSSIATAAASEAQATASVRSAKELYSGALWLTASLPFLNRVRRHRG